MQQFFLKGVIDRFEGTNAIIKTEDSQQIIWPIKNLPESIKAGEAVRLIFSTSKTETQERKETAKAMLNEILGE